ncbi:DUF885 domain-containing protein [Egicoccus halophilus]|uniref:DUF885 domain-containing protein n=1 Tax=Egicoccus halophilus TaxID=1670830 RepID=A0A8J3ACQ4_9ACTN|nr:DUF885 domain-containing protein [Egicoccus halophilus]GGI08811.1 hypothetical protein GCM10011354_30950 [Egicoccus halophilus]
MSDHLARADELVGRYLDHVRDHAPVEATRLGIRDRDGELPDLSPVALAARSRDLAVLAAEVRVALAEVPAAGAGDDREAAGDLQLLADELEYRQFLLDVRPRYVLDPLAALETISAGIHEHLRRLDLPVTEQRRRLAAAVARARRVPVLLEQAGSLLRSSPAPHLDVALQRLPGLIELVRDELPRRAEQLAGDVTHARDAGEVAAEGLEAYAALLDELHDEPSAPWRLGPQEHEVTLRAALGTSMAPAEIESRARDWIGEVCAEMAELAAATWQRRFPGEARPDDTDELLRRVLAQVADRQVPRDQLVPEARRAVDEARAFALASGLTDVPPAERLTVTEVPDYLRGIAVAFITQAPPLEPDTGCTYYLSPVPDSWDDDLAESFLREYNPAQLRSLAIHEGYPGHFVQLEHASQHPRVARRLLARPAFAEGWAVYIEREAVRAGFGDGDTSAVDGDDYRITQRKLELRIATNALLDVGLHAGELADEQALELLTCRAFQERAEAEGKLVRAKVTSGQLCSYFVGGEELGDLRREVEDAAGGDVDVRRFHQRVLSHGTPTVEIVRAALADDAPARRPFA